MGEAVKQAAEQGMRLVPAVELERAHGRIVALGQEVARLVEAAENPVELADLRGALAIRKANEETLHEELTRVKMELAMADKAAEAKAQQLDMVLKALGWARSALRSDSFCTEAGNVDALRQALLAGLVKRLGEAVW